MCRTPSKWIIHIIKDTDKALDRRHYIYRYTHISIPQTTNNNGNPDNNAPAVNTCTCVGTRPITCNAYIYPTCAQCSLSVYSMFVHMYTCAFMHTHVCHTGKSVAHTSHSNTSSSTLCPVAGKCAVTALSMATEKYTGIALSEAEVLLKPHRIVIVRMSAA